MNQNNGGTKILKELSPERMRQFHDYAEEYPNKRSALMMVLRLAEEEFGSITDEAMEIVAGLCNVHVSHVQGMVTFYTHFKRPFHGKHRFMVCATLMCALENNTSQALKQIKDRLGIGPGQITFDGLFSCEKVECLADCDKPPVVQCDSEHFCSMKGPALDAYMDKLIQAAGKSVEEYQGKAPVDMDARVPTLPSHYDFVGEAALTTHVPGPLANPFSVPVADGVTGSGKPYSASAAAASSTNLSDSRNGAKHG